MAYLRTASIWQTNWRLRRASFFFTRTGFSLVGVLLAVGIVGILLTIIMTMAGNMSVFLKRIEIRDQGSSLVKEITTLWREPTLCQESFSGVIFNPSASEANPRIVSMYSRRLGNTPFSAYQPENPYVLREVRLVTLAGPTRGRYFVRGSAMLEARTPSLSVPSLRPTEFAMVVEISGGGAISNCAVGQDTERRLTVVETGIEKKLYNYPNWKLTAPKPVNEETVAVKATCPGGFEVFECVGGFGQPGSTVCTDIDTSIVLHDSDGGTFKRGPNKVNGIGQGGVEISERLIHMSQSDDNGDNADDTCTASVTAWFTDTTDPIYTYLKNRPICVRARCVPK